MRRKAARPFTDDRKRRSLLIVLTAVLATSSTVAAQPFDSHAEHHPGQAPTPAQSPPQPSPPSSGGEMGMMGMMGGPPKKQFYPQLMELPAMTLEARRKIEADARGRIDAGNAALGQAQDEYHRAMADNDSVAMVAAMASQRAALAELESGTSALRALAEGQAPRQIALNWFRGQMNLAAPTAPTDGAVGLLGLSWFHVVSMTTVTLLALTMLVLGIGRRRRSIALVDRLTSGASVRPAATSPPAAAAPALSLPPPPFPKPVEPVPPPLSAPAATSTWSGALRVASIVQETPHVKTFRLVEPNGGAIPFTFIPGQFLTFSARIDGKVANRSYSIASPPTRSSYAEITVKREDEGDFSRFLHDKVAIGDSLQVRGPSGVFTFEGGSADSIVLIAGGVGITPLMCVIRHLTDMSWPGEIFLVLAARDTDELIFREELEYLQRRHRNLHVVAAIGARSEGSAWMGLEGQITKDVLTHAVPGIERRRVHLCGPPPMMDAIRRMLGELGVPASRIKTEAFGPAMGLIPPPGLTPSPVPPVSVTRLMQEVEAAVPPSAEAMAVPGPATATISFIRSAKSAPLPPDSTVLEVAESIGVPIDYSCRAGTCGLCKTKLLDGQVTMEVQDALTEEDKATGMILACQARSVGNVTVDA